MLLLAGAGDVIEGWNVGIDGIINDLDFILYVSFQINHLSLCLE